MQPEVLPQPAYGGDLLPGSSRRRRWLPVVSVAAVLAAVGAAVVVVVSGAGGSMSAAQAMALVHGADARAVRAGTSTVTLRMTMRVAGHTVTATGGGAFDYRRHTGRLAFDLAGVGEMQEVVTPTALFLRMPDGMNGVMGTATRPWLQVRFAALKAGGVDVGKLMSSNTQADPSQLLQLLSRSTSIHRDGTAVIRGTKTTKFSGTSTLLDMVRSDGITRSVDLSKLPPALSSSRIHLGVWVDGSGLARRMTMAMDMATYGSMSMTMDLDDFGKPVDVIVPPASIVTDISGEFGRVGG